MYERKLNQLESTINCHADNSHKHIIYRWTLVMKLEHFLRAIILLNRIFLEFSLHCLFVDFKITDTTGHKLLHINRLFQLDAQRFEFFFKSIFYLNKKIVHYN